MNSDMQSVSPSSPDYKKWATRAALTGAIATVASYAILGAKGDVTVGGMTMPGAIPAGLGEAAGSLIADGAHQWIFPMIPHDEKYDRMEAVALSVAASGLGTYAASSLIGNPDMLKAILLGSGSFVASDYTYNNLLTSGGMFLF